MGTLAVESVGHLPREISRFMRFIMLHGAIVVMPIQVIVNTEQRHSVEIQVSCRGVLQGASRWHV